MTHISRAGGVSHNANCDACLNTEDCELNQLAPSFRWELRATAETGISSAPAILPQAERGTGAVGAAPSARLGFGLAASKFASIGADPFDTECNVSLHIACRRAQKRR